MHFVKLGMLSDSLLKKNELNVKVKKKISHLTIALGKLKEENTKCGRP